MDAKVVWSERLTFKGSAGSGFSLPLGGSRDVGGDEDGFRPMELIAIGLAGCTAMDVISILLKKRQEITSFKVEVQADRANEHPRVFTQLRILYRISGVNVDEKSVQRAIELSETKYCPAQAMLGKIAPISLEYEITS